MRRRLRNWQTLSNVTVMAGEERTAKTKILSLGKAYGFEYLIQLVLPIALVRLITPEEFGQYRIFWLVIATVMALAPMHMPQSLLFFLPQSNRRERNEYVTNVLLFLIMAGLVSAAVVSPWHSLIPPRFTSFVSSNYLFPAFVLTWVTSSLIEHLFNAQGRTLMQSRVIIILSILRAAAVLPVAFLTREVNSVIISLFVYSLLRMVLLFYFYISALKNERPVLDFVSFRRQLIYALPFGVAGGIFVLKVQADHWVAAALFSPAMYAVFSLGGYVAPMANLIRQSVDNATLPIISRSHLAGDKTGLFLVFQNANVTAAFVLIPMLFFVFTFANQIVELVFTRSYSLGADVIRVYALGYIFSALNVNSLLRVYGAGGYAVSLNLCLLPLSILISIFGANYFGVVGCALGGATTMFIGEMANLWLASHVASMPIARLLRWQSLSTLFVSAGISAAIANLVVSYAVVPIFGGLFLGAVVLGCTYLVVVAIARRFEMIDIEIGHINARRPQ